MTTPTLGEMTNQELQTILGELVGCHRDYCSPIEGYYAVAEVRKGMDPHKHNDFIAHLWEITGNKLSANFWSEYNFRGLYACIDASPRHQTIALILTLTP
jgi:hypothetical protein